MREAERVAIEEKVRVARAGVCCLCGCDYLNPCAVVCFHTGIVNPCSFVAGTDRRVCTGHKPHEIAAVAQALKETLPFEERMRQLRQRHGLPDAEPPLEPPPPPPLMPPPRNGAPLPPRPHSEVEDAP